MGLLVADSEEAALMFFKQFAVFMVVAGVLAVLSACGGVGEAKPAPDFSLFMYQGADKVGGQEINFSQAIAQGKPIVLNFWGGSCPPCRAEMPDIEEVSRRYDGRVLFLGLDVGPFLLLGTREEGRALLQELDITYPAGSTDNRDVLRDYTVTGLPRTVFIRSDGMIMRKWDGLLSESKLEELVEDLIAAS